MDTLEYLKARFEISEYPETMPIKIPNIGRYTLAKAFRELGFTLGVEVGVETGGFSKWLCEHNENLHLYAVDAWKAYRGYRDHVSQSKLDGFYEEAKKRTAGLNVELVRKFSMDAVKDFKDSSLDFVFIDGNHSFVYCTNDIHWWSQKVRRGGIISGHDYKTFRRPNLMHVIQVVNGYTDAYDIRPWFLLCAAEVEDKDASKTWLWVKA